MFARKSVLSSTARATAIATVAALTLTAVAPSAFAGPRGRVGGVAAAAAVAGVVGTGVAIAAAQNRAGYYDDGYAYYGGPAYVVPQAYPYGGYGNYGYGGYNGATQGYAVPDGH
jgi:hypothetical protein